MDLLALLLKIFTQLERQQRRISSLKLEEAERMALRLLTLAKHSTMVHLTLPLAKALLMLKIAPLVYASALLALAQGM